MLPQEIIDLIDQLSKTKDNIIQYSDHELQAYQRTTYNVLQGRTQTSSWRVLLDESKTKWCIRNRSGFKSINKSPNDQVVTGPKKLKELLLSKSNNDVLVATIALDQAAEKKYGRTE